MGLRNWFSRPKMSSKSEPGFPVRPLFILALCRICEPIAFTSIFPYIYYMVQSFGIAQDEKHISIYAGMVTSAFAIAEFTASIFWGWLSDKIGRKPVLLTGLAGTGISMLVFGFAKSLPVALLARTLGGLLNGNIGVILTTVGEVVTVESHQSRAFSIMPFVWCLGSIIGAVIGGTLADPARNYPSVFGDSAFFKEHPYFLPNAVCTAVVLLGLTVGFLFLEETHQDKRSRNRKDMGLVLGRQLLRAIPCLGSSTSDDTETEEERRTANDEKGDYQPIPTSPQMKASTSPTEDSSATISEKDIAANITESISEPKVPFYRSLTKQIKLIIVSYGLLAFHTIALEQLLPILFASPDSDVPPIFPFKFDGGFGLSAKTIGLILSLQGFLQMIAQIIIFPLVSDRFGPLTTFRIAVLSYPFLYLLVPYLALVPQSIRFLCITIVLLWKVTAQSFSFPSQSIMLANSAPSKRVLGTLNGLAMSSASLARAFGPTLIGYIHAVGRQSGYSIFSWWSCALVALIGAIVSCSMATPERQLVKDAVLGEDRDEEKGEAQPLLLARLSDEIDASSCQSTEVDERTQ